MLFYLMSFTTFVFSHTNTHVHSFFLIVYLHTFDSMNVRNLAYFLRKHFFL